MKIQEIYRDNANMSNQKILKKKILLKFQGFLLNDKHNRVKLSLRLIRKQRINGKKLNRLKKNKKNFSNKTVQN